LTERKVLAARQEALHISRCSHKETIGGVLYVWEYEELIHFSERRTLEEVKSHYFWHNQTKLMRELIQVRIVNWVKIIDL